MRFRWDPCKEALNVTKHKVRSRKRRPFSEIHSPSPNQIQNIPTQNIASGQQVSRLGGRLWSCPPAIRASAASISLDTSRALTSCWIKTQLDAWRWIEMRQGTKGPMRVKVLHGGCGSTRMSMNRRISALDRDAPAEPAQVQSLVRRAGHARRALAYVQGQRYFVKRALENAMQQGGLGITRSVAGDDGITTT